MRSHPDYLAGETYLFTGDASVVNGFKFLSGIGVRDLTTGNENEARATAFTDNANTADKDGADTSI